MPKAYWVAQVTVTNPDKYTGYQQLAPEAFARFGARFLARGGASDTLEGDGFQRHVIIEFDSLDDARACYNSPEYTAARAKRDGACQAQIFLVEGLELDP